MAQPAEAVEKKPYHEPQLVVYGTLAELTLAATVGQMLDNEVDPQGVQLRTN